MEYVQRTSSHVPEWLAGVYANGHIYGGLKIPDVDSLLVGFSPGTRVIGWDTVPAADRPPVVWLIHLCFDAMVGIGFLLLLAGLWALWGWWRHRSLPRQRLFWLLGAVSGLAAIVAMKAGWVVTEVGRQPWVVYRLQTTTPGGDHQRRRDHQPQHRHRPVRGARHRDGPDPPGAGPALAPWRRARDRRSLRPAAGDPGRRGHAGHESRPGQDMIAAATVGGILLATVTLYGILGGADFGGGLWDLLAGGDRRGHAPRRLIDESITPVWEANHVWLVFALVIFWTAFPVAFASVMTAAALPLWLAVGGIVLRGAGFAFRKEVSGLGLQRAFGAVFAFSSLLTPFFMGTVIGAVAPARYPPTPATRASPPGRTRPRC